MEPAPALSTSYGFHEAQPKHSHGSVLRACHGDALGYYGRSPRAAYPDITSQAGWGAPTSGLWCPWRPLPIPCPFQEGMTDRGSRVLCGPVHTAPHQHPPPTHICHMLFKSQTTTSVAEVKWEAHNRCRGSTHGGAQPALPTPRLGVQQPRAARVVISSNHQVGKGVRGQPQARGRSSATSPSPCSEGAPGTAAIV